MSEELKTWFLETFIALHGYRFGPHETSTDYVRQATGWECYGCGAKAETSWPKWGEPDMEHEHGCKYLQLMELVGQ